MQKKVNVSLSTAMHTNGKYPVARIQLDIRKESRWVAVARPHRGSLSPAEFKLSLVPSP